MLDYVFSLTLGAADEQVGQCDEAGNNSYCSSVVKVLARLAADPWALGTLSRDDVLLHCIRSTKESVVISSHPYHRRSIVRNFEPKHPAGRGMTHFERSLWRLKMVSHEAQLLHCSALLPEERKRDHALMFTLTNYGILLVCKFLEVWDEFNALSKDDPKIRDIAGAISPAIRRITKTWPQIRQYRNWAIAHPYSVNDETDITPPWALLEAEIGPTQHAEIIVLLECVRYAVAGTLAYFGDTYRALGSTFDPPPYQPPKRGVRDGAEAEAERRRLAIQLNKRLHAIGVDLEDPVFHEYRCPPK